MSNTEAVFDIWTPLEVCPNCGASIDEEPDVSEPCPVCGWEPADEEIEEIEEETV